MKLLLLSAVLALAAGCNDQKTFQQVPVVGLPCAAQGQRLQVPLVMEAKHSDGTLRMTYVGGQASDRLHTVGLPKSAETKLEIRFGHCRGVNDCRQPSWIAGTQTVTVDTRLADPQLLVGVPGVHACVASGS